MADQPRPSDLLVCLGDFLLLVLCWVRRGTGPAPPEGTLHDARVDWRPGCSHCWGVASLGLMFWATFAFMVASGAFA